MEEIQPIATPEIGRNGMEPSMKSHQEDYPNQTVVQDPIDIEDNDLGGEDVEVDFFHYEEDYEPFEEPNDEIEESNVIDPLPTIPKRDTFQLSLLFQESNVRFTNEEFNAMLNVDSMFDPSNPNFSCSTFHSMHNSILSSSSMDNQLGGLDMNQNTFTHSSSSKRKSNEGVKETASSILMWFKKQRT
ncbi:hypothetical protein V2J09_008560 [Rumex salicifolius]